MIGCSYLHFLSSHSLLSALWLGFISCLFTHYQVIFEKPVIHLQIQRQFSAAWQDLSACLNGDHAVSIENRLMLCCVCFILFCFITVIPPLPGFPDTFPVATSLISLQSPLTIGFPLDLALGSSTFPQSYFFFPLGDLRLSWWS